MLTVTEVLWSVGLSVGQSQEPYKTAEPLRVTFGVWILLGTRYQDISAPFVRTSFGSRSFSVAAPKIWNSLPLSLRTCTSPDTFRRHLKTHYCQRAFLSI